MWPIIAALVAGGIALATQHERGKSSSKGGDKPKTYDDGVKEGRALFASELKEKRDQDKRTRKLAARQAQLMMSRQRPTRLDDDTDDDDDEDIFELARMARGESRRSKSVESSKPTEGKEGTK